MLKREFLPFMAKTQKKVKMAKSKAIKDDGSAQNGILTGSSVDSGAHLQCAA